MPMPDKNPDREGNPISVINPLYSYEITRVSRWVDYVDFSPRVFFKIQKRGRWMNVKRLMRLKVWIYVFYDPEAIEEGEWLVIWLWVRTSYINLFKTDIMKNVVVKTLEMVDSISDHAIGMQNWAMALLTRIDIHKSVSNYKDFFRDKLNKENPYFSHIKAQEHIREAETGNEFKKRRGQLDEVT